ncbi:MAG TPA: zinc-binding dehydrogenase [Streptosporangiaceae bacterium]|nr:zinc-binding dehydrogenase [Streptosporangiaceae bacterium]
MRAAYAAAIDPQHPLSGLQVGTIEEPAQPADDWVRVEVRASALNHHDLWSLRGVGLAESQLPMVLGCDAAGIGPDGNEVIVHAVVGDPSGGDETLDPKRSLLSEVYPGTLADVVWVPARNLVPKPESMTFVEAACLPTAWLTAYKMLLSKGKVRSGNAVLVQGAGGGVATAAVVLARELGARVYATSRSEAKREQITALGATAVEPGARLPERVDVVIETVGTPTIEHSLKSTAPGGRIVICGSTGGHLAEIDLRRVFFLQLELLGSTMGTRDELAAVAGLMAGRSVKPVIDSVYPFGQASDAFARLASGEAFGKIVLDHVAR